MSRAERKHQAAIKREMIFLHLNKLLSAALKEGKTTGEAIDIVVAWCEREAKAKPQEKQMVLDATIRLRQEVFEKAAAMKKER